MRKRLQAALADRPLRHRLNTARLKILRSTLNVARVVVIGGGIAGMYFTSRLLELVKDVEVVLVEPEDHHFFMVGVLMAFGGGAGGFSRARLPAVHPPSG